MTAKWFVDTRIKPISPLEALEQFLFCITLSPTRKKLEPTLKSGNPPLYGFTNSRIAGLS